MSAPGTAYLHQATWTGIGAIALWTSLALLTRLAYQVPPLQLTAMAFAVSGGAGLAVLALRGRLSILRQIPVLGWVHGVGGLFLYHALYFAALTLAPAVEANLLNYLWPLLIVVFSCVLLGMRLRWTHLLGVALGFAGCMLLIGREAAFQTDAIPGYAAALGAATVWALYSVLSRWFTRVPTDALAGFCAVSALLAGGLHLGMETTVLPDWHVYAVILLIGAGPVGGAFFLWDIGMKAGDPRVLGTLAYATPVVSTLLLVAAGEATLTVWVGLAAVLVAAGGAWAARAG